MVADLNVKKYLIACIDVIKNVIIMKAHKRIQQVTKITNVKRIA